MDECPTHEACKENKTIPTVQSLYYGFIEMKERKPACICFESAIHRPLNIVGDKSKYLNISGFPLVVKPYQK